MKKILMAWMALTAFLFVFFPNYEALDHTYQTSLWTYPANERAVDMVRSPLQLALKIGNTTAEGSLMRWHRVRLGIPFQAVTLDIQAQRPILQARLELIFWIINFFVGLAVGFFGFCLFQNTLVRRRLASMSPSLDHTTSHGSSTKCSPEKPQP